MLPQLMYILLMSAALLLAAYQHGKPKEGKHNFWIALTALAIQITLLSLGGFFNGLFTK